MSPSRRPSVPSFVLLALVVCTTPTGAQTCRPIGQGVHTVATSFSFDDPSFGNLPNGAAHAQDVIVAHAGWQYLAYWDLDRRLAIARRRPPADDWQVVTFDDYQILGQDAHNSVNLGISPADDRIHLAFDHHGDDLHYRRSLAGLAADPDPGSWTPASFEAITDTLDPERGPVTELTYPRFVPTPGRGLLFVYREFGSGNGRMRMVDYDGTTGQWSNDRVFIERTGAYSDPLGGDSNSRNPYLNRIAYDDQGTLHATWTWREKAPIPYNRDIAYAYSEDDGVRWFNGADELVADTALGESISASSPGIHGVLIGAELGLMNDQGHVVDDRGRVHVVMYYKDEPDTEVSYGSSSDSHYNHHWRDADGVWRHSRLDTIGNRPKLLADSRGRLLLAYQSGGALAFDVATPEADYLDWTTVCEIDEGFGSSAQVDPVLFDAVEVLSVAMQGRAAVDGDPTPLSVATLRILPSSVCEDTDQVCARAHDLDTERDTYVRGGIHADTNYGTESGLTVHDAPDEDDRRLAFLRFFLGDLPGGGPITRATLELEVADSGAGWQPSDLLARRCAKDSWSETTTTWNDRPVPDGPSYPAGGDTSTVSIDVTEALAAELARGGERITFELSGARPSPDGAVTLRSREAGPDSIPRLAIEQRNTVSAEADTYARSGVHADTNYGDEPQLVIKEDAPADFDRVTYVRFDVTPLEGTGPIERVFLFATATARGDLTRTTSYVAHATDDAWDEATLTWNARPLPGAELDAHYGRDELRWDVTAATLEALDDDGIVSFALRSNREGASRALTVGSREASDPSSRPYLLVRYTR